VIFCLLVITYLRSRNSSSINRNLEKCQKKVVEPIHQGQLTWTTTSTDVVFRIAPSNKKGFALALLSQCFAMGYFFGPFISGRVLDLFGFASIIWLSISCCCFVVFTILFRRLF
jgi:predicted MFS family arabinose efflux permease